jgi:hypothetical protein
MTGQTPNVLRSKSSVAVRATVLKTRICRVVERKHIR